MGRKGVGLDLKIAAIEKYKRGEGSQASIAQKYGVSRASFRQWVANYESMGSSGLKNESTNSNYSKELKTTAVEAYLRGEGSLLEICKLFSIRSNTQLRDWIKVYNGHKELWTSSGRERGIYMTKGRTTTIDERIEIISYCISNGKNYSSTIEKYGVPYQQIYSWVNKYEEKGVDDLIDKRGKCKLFDELNEGERLRAELKMLQAENNRKDMEIAVLKKSRKSKGGEFTVL